jgi:tetratricopeptide (TPR) repeat protein
MRGLTAVGVLGLLSSGWLTWIKAPISGGANPSLSVGWLVGVIGGVAAIAWVGRSTRVLDVCGVAGLGLAGLALLYLACMDPALWYLVDENAQAANIIGFSHRFLPGNYGIQPTFRHSLDTETLLGRLATAAYFMSWGWVICLASSLLLLCHGRTNLSCWPRLTWISLPAALLFGGQALVLASCLTAEYIQDQGHRQMALGRYADAIRRYERVQRWNPQSAISLQVHVRLGEAYYHLNMQTHPNARLYRGQRYVQEGNYKTALAEYLVAVQEARSPVKEVLAKQLAWTHVDRGIAQLRKGQVGSAIGHWEQALAFDADQIQAAYFLARAYFEQSQYEQSIAMSRLLLSRSDNRLLNANLQFNIGDSYWRLREFDQARLAYEASKRLDSYGNFRIFKSLGGT